MRRTVRFEVILNVSFKISPLKTPINCFYGFDDLEIIFTKCCCINNSHHFQGNLPSYIGGITKI